MHGPFDVPSTEAQLMLAAPLNVNSRPNLDVVRQIRNADSVTGRTPTRYVVYFLPTSSESDSAQYEMPFEFVRKRVAPVRSKNHRKAYREKWWIHGEPRPAMLAALSELERFIVTPRVSKHRLFVYLSRRELPSDALAVIARDDDYTFGVLHSRAHEVWALALGTQLETRPRYTPTTTFETFPFPRPTDEQREAIAAAARELNSLREAWLNPPEASQVGAQQPVLSLSKDAARPLLKERTLTNLYNARPTWLANAHERLDCAVLDAYGWPPYGLGNEELLESLLNLNLSREPVE